MSVRQSRDRGRETRISPFRHPPLRPLGGISPSVMPAWSGPVEREGERVPPEGGKRSASRSAVAADLALARSRLAAGATGESANHCRRVLAADPGNADALLLLGQIAFQSGQIATSRTLLERAVAARPGDAPAWLALSALHLARGDVAAAAHACRGALQRAPDLPECHMEQGSIFAAAGQFDLAEAAYRRALSLRPGDADALVNIGSALFRQGRLEEAAAAHRDAIARNPSHAYASKNLAAAWRALGRYEEALVSYRQAIALQPALAEAHRDEALLLLLLGDYANGWEKYEWRWRCRAVGARPLAGDRWNGESVDGEALLLHAEQGLGDTIQFARYAPLVASRGVRVVLAVPEALRTLMAGGLAGGLQVRAAETLPPGRYRHAYLLSLPRIFRTRLDTIPAAIPYIKPPPDALARWAGALPQAGELRIGLAWAGNPRHENDANRSLPLETLLPLLSIPGTRFASLQVGDAAAAIGRAPAPPILDWGSRLTGFADTAGAMANLDLVIAVDTAVAHLAGAMGKPVWLLLPHVPDWRWLLGREDSPWYPTMRLFRQPSRGDWTAVVARVAAELRRLALEAAAIRAVAGG